MIRNLRSCWASSARAALVAIPGRSALALVMLGLGLATGALIGPAGARAAGPVHWDYPESFSFDLLELAGVAFDSNGHLMPGLSAQSLIDAGPEVFWRVVSDGDGGLFVGSGHDGQIWRIDADGEAKLWAEVEGPEVFSLVTAGDDLFAGCGPSGQLYRIDAEGQVTLWGQVTDSYIWAQVRAENGAHYLAVGSPAAIYRVDGQDTLTELVVLPAYNALDLALADDGTLLVATQGPGLIYRIDLGAPERPQLLFEAKQDEVRQLLTGPDGQWYALALAGEEGAKPNGAETEGKMVNGLELMDIRPLETSQPKAVLYRLDFSGQAVQTWSGSVDLMIAMYSDTWGWLGGGSGDEVTGQARLWALEEPSSIRPLASWAGGEVLDLLVRPGRDGKEEIVACMAHPGQVVLLDSATGSSAVALSQPLDGGQAIRWGRLSWRSGTGEGRSKGKGVAWSVRGGARSVPDETWSDWSGTWRDHDHPIELPATRYLQWRVEFTEPEGADRIAAVSVSGYEPNLPPRIESLTLQQPGVVTWGSLMNHSENVTETLKSGLRVEYSLSSRRDRRADPQRVAEVRPVRSYRWSAVDPNSDRLLYQLEYQTVGEDVWRSIGKETQEEVGTWDTANVPDGRYRVRLRASDRRDNPAATTEMVYRTLAPLVVDNTSPKVGDLELRRTEAGFSLRLKVEDEVSQLAGAQIEMPDGSVERLDPKDGICDSRREDFAVELVFPPPGQTPPPEPWQVSVEVYDRQGNIATALGEVR